MSDVVAVLLFAFIMFVAGAFGGLAVIFTFMYLLKDKINAEIDRRMDQLDNIVDSE